MEQLSFERPREKLQRSSASYLTTVELIQVVIGSGTAQSSGARIAKHIARLMAISPPSMHDLCAVRGVGVARASQVIAALELGRRAAAFSAHNKPLIDTAKARQRVSHRRKLTALIYYFDGNNDPIHDLEVDLTRYHAVVAMRKIAQAAIEFRARKIILFMGSRQSLAPVSLRELDFVKRVKNGLALIAVSLVDVFRVDTQTVERWYD